MSTAEFARKVFTMVAQWPPESHDGHDFEMAYQAKVAADRIRFAIRTIEQQDGRDEQLREVGLQLLDALDRLESADRRFQTEWRNPPATSGSPRTNQQLEQSVEGRP